MDIQMMLNLIAYILIIVGVLLAGIRLFTCCDQGMSGCRYALSLTWLCAIAGLILNVIGLHVAVSWQNLLHQIAYALLLAAALMACPMVSCEETCHNSAINYKLISWGSVTAGLILLVIPVYLSAPTQYLLASIAYPLFIVGLLLATTKLFRSILGGFAWACFLAGFILLIVALYQ